MQYTRILATALCATLWLIPSISRADEGGSIPYLQESHSELVLRFNPASKAAAHPAIRDAVASFLVTGISDSEVFSRNIDRLNLTLSAPAFTGPVTEYDKGLADFGGMEPSIAELAQSSGMVPGDSMSILKGLDPAVLAAGTGMRPLMRSVVGNLQDAGFTIGSDGRLLDNGRTPVSLRFLVATTPLSQEQANAVTSAVKSLSRVGIDVRVNSRTTLSSPSDLSNNDALLSIEISQGANKSIIQWALMAAWEGTPVGAFTDGLPRPISHHQEMSIFAALDGYLAAEGYVMSLARTPPAIDYADKASRVFAWKKAEAGDFLVATCGQAELIHVGTTATEMILWNTAQPLAFYFPLAGGGGEDIRVALVARPEIIDIQDKGLVRIEAPTGEHGYPTELTNRFPLEIPVKRDGPVLFFEDPGPYLEFALLVKKHTTGGDEVFAVPMVFQDGMDRDAPLIEPIADNAETVQSLGNHVFGDTSTCAASVFFSDERLTFSSLASGE